MTQRVWRAALLTATGVAWLGTHAVAQKTLTELGHEGFVLRGQLSAATLDLVACDLQTAVRVLRSTAASTGDPPQVVAVDNARAIREWLPEFNERGRGNPLGAYWHGLFGDHIVLRVDAPPAERLRRVLHEYAHFVTRRANPDPAPWLDEGVSEIWEHTAIAPGAIEIGRPVAEHVQRLRSGKDWIPVSELLAANAIPTRRDATWAMFYAESWALVHYLVFESGGGALVFNQPLDRGDIPTDADLRKYVQGSMGAVVKISTTAKGRECPVQTTVRQMSPLESLLDRAQALADGERPEAALPLLREALASAPDNVSVMETIGFIHFRGNRPQEAAALFDRVIADGTATFISYYYRAVLSGPIPEAIGTGARISEVDYLRKAIALKPDFAPAIQRLRELTGKHLSLPLGAGV